jgi:hypothetical protein
MPFELTSARKLADAKIAAERDKLIAALPEQVESVTRQQAAQGMYKSGNTLVRITDVCSTALDSLGAVLLAQYGSVASESVNPTTEFVDELAKASRDQLEPLFGWCIARVRREITTINAPKTEPELIGRLQTKRAQVLGDVELAIRSAVANRNRSTLRNASKAVLGWISKLLRLLSGG